MPLNLHYFAYSPPCRAVLATAQRLGLKPNIVKVNLMKGEHMTPEFLKLNPNHTVPVLEDNGFVLFESRAMMKYLVNKYQPDSPLYPRDVNKRALVDQCLYYDCGTLFPAQNGVVHPKLFLKEEPSDEAKDKFEEKISILETILAKQKFLTGDDATLADISVGAELPNLTLVGKDLKALLSSKLNDYLDRVHVAIPELKALNDVVLNPKKKA